MCILSALTDRSTYWTLISTSPINNLVEEAVVVVVEVGVVDEAVAVHAMVVVTEVHAKVVATVVGKVVATVVVMEAATVVATARLLPDVVER